MSSGELSCVSSQERAIKLLPKRILSKTESNESPALWASQSWFRLYRDAGSWRAPPPGAGARAVAEPPAVRTVCCCCHRWGWHRDVWSSCWAVTLHWSIINNFEYSTNIHNGCVIFLFFSLFFFCSQLTFLLFVFVALYVITGILVFLISSTLSCSIAALPSELNSIIRNELDEQQL